MKTVFNNWKKKTVKAFTLAEMLIVLLIISVLMLLFVPNLTKQKDIIQEKGNAAIVKVVESQAQVYELNTGEKATITKMKGKEITEEQAKAYNDYYKKHSDQNRQVSN